MLRTRIALTIALAALTGGPAADRAGFVPAVSAAVLSAQALYADAMAKDQAVRTGIANGMAPEALNKAVRTVFAAYDALVRQYPTSGYSDDALWRAAQLATDVAALVKDAAYDATAARYLKRLASEYPSSKHSRQLPAPSATAAGKSAGPSVPATPVATVGVTSAATVREGTAPPLAAGTASLATGNTSPTGATPPPARPASSGSTALATGTAPPASTAATAAPAALPQAPPATAQASGRGRLLAVHRAVLPDVVRITLDIDQEVTFHQERLTGPDRIFFDFAKTTTARSLAERTLRFDQDPDVVRQVRIGQQSSDTTRVVLDTTGVASCSATPLYAPYRLVIDCVRATPSAPSASVSGRRNAAKTETPKTPAVAAEPRLTPLTPATLARKTPPTAIPAPAATSGVALISAATPPVLIARRVPLATHAFVLGVARLSPAALAQLTAEAAGPSPSTSESSTAAAATGLPAGPTPGIASTAIPAAVITAAAVAPASPPLAARQTAPASPPGAPSATAGSGGSGAPVAPVAPARNLDGGLSIARQLGLTVSRIVIDPGHGGHDPGARGAGTTEAAVVLDIALRLEKLLQQEDGVEVILTRRTDDFVPLEERTAIANREGADLFLSIHANASSIAQAAGVETYFLNFARDRVAAAVAARENAASGKPMSALPDVVKTIALNGKVDESRDLATQVQRALVQKLKPAHQNLRDLGVKQAPFVVLIGAAMPSVLAEVSFMTNDQEAKLLKAPNYRQRIAEALFTAVQRYQTSLTRINATGQ